MSEAVENQAELTEEEQYDAEYEKAFFGDEDNQSAEAEPEMEEEPKNGSVEEAAVHDETPEDEDGDGDDVTDDAQGDTDDSADTGELVTLRWKGKDIEVTKEEAIKLAQQGFDYTFKTQSLSKYKKQFETMEQSGITEDDIALLAKAKQGDKEAIAYLMKDSKVDPVDMLDVEVPDKVVQKPQSELVISDQVKPLIEQVSQNPELLGKLQEAEKSLPDAVINAMAQDADLFYGVVSEVERGSFDEVIPQVHRRIATLSEVDRAYVMQNPQAFAQIYVEAKSGGQPQTVAPAQTKQKAKPNMAEVGVKKSSTQSRQTEVIKDAFSSDEEYQKILQRVRSRAY